METDTGPGAGPVAAGIDAGGNPRHGPVRPVGAALGAVLCGVVLAALYAAAAIEPVEDLLHVRFVLGTDGFMAGTLPLAAAWACGPVAAAIAGFALAMATVRSERLAGTWMGVLTFFLTVLLAAVAVSLAALPVESVAPAEVAWGLVTGVPILALMAAAILAPLCALCVMAGIAWAWILRRTFTGSGTGIRSTVSPVPGRAFLIAIGVGLTAGWLLLAPLLGSLSEGVFVD